jgi:PAS domain S-box-containing protein
MMFAAIVEGAPDGVLLVDPGGRITFANRYVETLLGYAPEALIGKTIEFLMPERLRGRHLSHRAAFQASPSTRAMGSGLELVALRGDGSELPVEISLSPLSSEDGTYVTAIVRDVSERKALQAAHQRLYAEAEMQLDRERIARDLHDGVMQSLYGVGLGLMHVQGTAREPEVGAGIGEAIQALNAVIADIRAYVMNLPVERAHGELASQLTALSDELRDNSSIAVTVDVADDLPALSDEQQSAFVQVAREALVNVQRHARAQHVRISLRGDEGRVILEVRDDGQGFDPATHAGQEHMGLRNMRSRAEQLGAVLEVQSAIAAGTAVRLFVATSN